jgi:DNA-directed RNA polymerase subunit beta'
MEVSSRNCEWDPYNGVIVSEFTGKIAYEDLEQGQSFMVEIKSKLVSKKSNFGIKIKKIPTLLVYGKDGELIVLTTYQLVPLNG